MGIKITKLFLIICLILGIFSNTSAVFADGVSPTPGPCTDTAPTEAPNLYQITPGQGSATLYFSPPSGSYTGFIISYGLDANANTYSATMTQGTTTGAITYTVNALTPNSKYYFKVQAINNCATGPFSSAVSADIGSSGSTTSPTGTSTGAVKTPVTGPEDILYFGLAGLLVAAGGFGVFLKNK